MSELCLVLGSNSFSGSSFVNHLLTKGMDVLGCSRSPEPHTAFLPYKWSKQQANFTFQQLDINKDLDELMDLVESKRPAYVVNFSAQSMVAESWANPDHWFMTNVVSTIRFHERLRRCSFLKKYVHVSTPEVYGSTGGFISEDTSFNPSTPYAVSRAAADMSLRTFFHAYKFPVVFTRAANVFGPGQQLYRIIPRTILFVRLRRKLQLHGGGASTRSFIHINDVSEATDRIMREGAPGSAFHISTTEVVSVRTLVEMICELMNVNFSDHVEVVGERLGKDASYQLDSSRLKDQLGWDAKVSLEQGIKETIAWVVNWFDDLKQQPFDYIHKQ